ncbi:hypothetical protein H5410_021195 [Solanum commersonii]|uniref:Uncharacterized protein n=1 Tax=Solanum commersonii TaxID=4109 RepID=A0A9J5ZB93_SOLCO|nr:hypothetical protein H5410_021195 [Solanum commersonii]
MREYFENILLEHEIITDIGNKGKPDNVVIILDMWLIAGISFSLMDKLKTSFIPQGVFLYHLFYFLTTKVLNKALNQLFYCNEFKCFCMPKWKENLNHLASAYDTITFSSTDKKFWI